MSFSVPPVGGVNTRVHQDFSAPAELSAPLRWSSEPAPLARERKHAALTSSRRPTLAGQLRHPQFYVSVQKNM